MEYEENHIRTIVKKAGGQWNSTEKVWSLPYRKAVEFGLEKKLDKIQITIDQMFIRETAEQNLDSILNENSQQTKALNGLATALTEKIAAEFNTTLIPKIELMNQHFHKMHKAHKLRIRLLYVSKHVPESWK